MSEAVDALDIRGQANQLRDEDEPHELSVVPGRAGPGRLSGDNDNCQRQRRLQADSAFFQLGQDLNQASTANPALDVPATSTG